MKAGISPSVTVDAGAAPSLAKVLRTRLAQTLLATTAASTIVIAGPAYAQAASPSGSAASSAGGVPASTDAQTPAAQDTGATPATSAAQTNSVADIIVTANKRQQSINDVPQSITALTGDQLAAKGIYNIQELATVTPGLSYVDTGKSTPVYSLRGVGFFDGSLGARPTVSVYLDEAPLPFSIEAQGTAFDLERVEVLKGPQGILFGQNSTGGAINFIAAKPTKDWTAGGTFAFSRFNTADFQGFVSGPLSSTLEARLAVRSVQGGDWQYSYTRGDGHGQQDFTQGRFILDWRPVDRLKISLNANGFHDGSDTTAAQFRGFLPGVPARAPLVPLLPAYPIAPSNPRAADFNAGQQFRSHNGFYQGIAHVDYEVSRALNLTSITTYSREKVRQLIDTDGTSLTNLTTYTDGYVRTFSQEVRAAGRLGDLDYVVGGLYEKDRTEEGGYQDESYSTLAFSIAPPPFPPLDVFGTNVKQRFSTKAVFGNLDFQFLDRFVLHGGIRYTKADLSYEACSLAGSANLAAAYGLFTNIIRRGRGLPPVAAAAVGQCASLNPDLTPGLGTGTLNQDNISWRAGLDFKPRPGVLLYANASRGFKGGSVTSSPASINDQFRPVVQERVQAYEAGFKATFFNRKLDLTGAGFYYDYRDKQLQGKVVFTPNIFGPINALINVPKSRIVGAEAQAYLYPVTGLTLNAGVTYLDTKVIGDFQNFSFVGNAANFGGNAFPFTPKYQAVLGLDYRHPVSAGRSAFIGGDANIRSHTTAGFGNDPQAYIPGYTVINLRAGIERDDGRWRAELFGQNVTNEYYYTNVLKVIDSVRAYTGRPATYGIRFSFKY